MKKSNVVVLSLSRTTAAKMAPRYLGSLELAGFYEAAAGYVRPSKVLGIVLNTTGLNDDQARLALLEAQQETGLPANDPLRFGTDNLVDAILAFKETRQ
jgi:uncharacterized NAD-dependent epimerase/dehydratase family protein